MRNLDPTLITQNHQPNDFLEEVKYFCYYAFLLSVHGLILLLLCIIMSLLVTQVVTAHELVFIDKQVKDYQQLAKQVRPEVEVVVVDDIEQISKTLAQYRDLSAVHIVAHGAPGQIQLGDQWLDSDALEAYQATLSQWFAAYTDIPEVLLYGCRVAAARQGEAFVDKLSQITGAQVAASVDLTGFAALGGNWVLEYGAGASRLAFAQPGIEDYQYVLPAPTRAPDVVPDDVVFEWTEWTDSGGNSQNFNSPSKIAININETIDINRNIYILDRLDGGTDQIIKLNGNFNSVQPNGSSISLMSNACESGLASDLTLDDSGNIYIAMTGFYDDNGLICSLNNNLEFIQLKEYESLEPSAITINGTDNTFFITDLLTDNVSKVGIEPSIWFNLDHNSPPLSNPKSIAFDPNNNFVYVSDTYVDNAGKSRIQKFNSEGNYISEWSTNAPGTGIAVDEEGYVYVAQKDNNLIQVFDSEGGLLTQWGAARINGKFAVVDPTDSNDPASTFTPNDIAVDVTTEHRIAYVTDASKASVYAFKWYFSKPTISVSCVDGESIDFGTVYVNDDSAGTECTITGDAGVELSSSELSELLEPSNISKTTGCTSTTEQNCFTLEVDTSTEGNISGTVSINYSYTLDGLLFEKTYSFSVKGSIEQRQAYIKVFFVDANSNERTHIPATDGSFNFGTHNLEDHVVRTFVVENTADATADLQLKLDSWEISAPVILEANFSSETVAPGETATFELKLDTSQVINNNNTIGKISFDYSYNNGIEDKDLEYIIDLSGTVQLPPEKPDIQVSINSIPQKTGNVFDFNNTPIGTDVIKTLTLKNIGEQPLTLSSPPTFEQGRAFSFIETLEATETVNLAKNKEKSYQIKLDASTQGQFEDTLIIQSNDEDEGHYSIIVKGSVGDQPQQPAVTVTPRPNVGGIYLLPPERDLSISFEGNGQGYVEGFQIERVSSVQELELQYIDCDADVDNNQHDVCQYTFKTASKIKLTATPLPGSRFVAWEGRKCPEDGQIPVLVENIECIAHFTLDKAQLTVSTTGKGQVTSRPGGIQCGSQDKQCQQEFNGDTEITLVALPDLGWHFSGWQGDCDAGGSVSLKADSHCQAVFEPVKHPEYTLLIDVLGQGWVAAEGINQCTTTCQKDYHHELRVTLTATPKAGMIFNHWGGDCSGTAPTTQVVMDAVKRCTAAFSLPCPQTEIIYVNQAAQGNNNGCSWTHAFNELSTALKQVKQLPQVKQIWVAQGVYKPTSTTDRQATFQLINGVSIYGGFAGSETELRQRDTLVYPTILSGDIGQPHELSDNSYHVVTGYATDASAVLDGFIISDGNATEGDSCPHACGGGLLNHQGSPTIRYSLFKNNTAHYGGGLFNDYQSQATIKYCFFNDNFAEEGGGIANHNSSPRISHVVINNNVATHAGGGMINFNNSQPVLTHVNLTANVATTGGGLFNNHSSPLISHSMLADNMAAQGGGIANVNNSQPFLSHLVLSGNTVSDSGGALFNEHSQPFISQATISGNVAVNGGGIVNVASQLTVNNTILWNNTDSFTQLQVLDDNDSHSTISYSIIEGGWPGEHNQASDPLFAKLTDLVTNHMTISDFHLRTDSPAIDGGHNQHIPPDRTDAECADHQDGDGNTLEAVEIDFDGRPRLIDGDEDGIAVVDIGAYEATTAPLLYHVLTVTKTGNGSGQVISNKGGILCGKLCLHQYVHESTLTLMAQAEVGSTFIGWQGDCSGQSGRLNLMMSKDIHCVAQFSRDASKVPNEVIDTIASQPAEVPPCPLTGSIDFICNAQGQTATDITLEPTGNVSNVVLQGNISNQGILSNATIQPETTVNGGLLTGYVVNHGTITDFDFRGASLTGGTIGGAIENNSEIGGYFEDIRLPAGARISGGILKGNIIGVDPEHPAILEDLEISPGSYLENVIIGKNVIVDERIIQGPNVLFVDQGSHEPPSSEQPPTEAPSSEVPSTEEPPNEEPPIDDDDEPLPPPEQLNCSANATVIGNEQPKVSQTCFSGSLRSHDVERPNHIMLTHDEAKNIKISAQIQVDPSDVGQPADILIVMIHQTLTTAEDFMRVGMSDWQPWQHKNIEALQPALSYLQLPETLEVDIYQGDLSGAPKEFTAFVGYRLADQQIIYNGQDPIHFYVDRAPVPCIVYGVHDADINDTQFVHIDLSDSLTGVMKPLGPLNRDLDIEGLTLLPHIPNLVYGTSGAEAIIDGKKQGGLLYSIDRYSGELKVIGATGFDKVSALALHPLDQTLWAWGTRTGRDKWNGLIQIDPQTGQGHPVKQFEYEKKHIMEALAWQPQGQLLYAASYRTLWAYDPETQALNPICNSIGKGRIESMDAQPNGLLLLGIDQNAGMAVINVYDPEACEIVNERVFEAVDYDDLESIVWPVEECYNNSWMSRAVE